MNDFGGKAPAENLASLLSDIRPVAGMYGCAGISCSLVCFSYIVCIANYPAQVEALAAETVRTWLQTQNPIAEGNCKWILRS